MTVLNSLYDKYSQTDVFKNKKIALCIHLEAKTAYLALTIKKLGAEISITNSNQLSTKDDVSATLEKNGIHIFVICDANQKEFQSFLKPIIGDKAHIVVDDGGDVCKLLHNFSEYVKKIKGICEKNNIRRFTIKTIG